MRWPSPPPLLLVLSMAASGAACGTKEPPAPSTPAPTALSATAAAVVAPRPMMLDQTGIVSAWMDPSMDPCQDYFAYACGGFAKSTSIPPDRPEWSVSSAVVEANEEFLHDVLKTAAKSPGDDAALRKIGDYYAACTDEDGVERAGALPIQPLLDDLGKITDAK